MGKVGRQSHTAGQTRKDETSLIVDFDRMRFDAWRTNKQNIMFVQDVLIIGAVAEQTPMQNDHTFTSHLDLHSAFPSRCAISESSRSW